MLVTPRTVKAAQFAYDAHHNQFTRAGIPYIIHPFAVADSMTSESDTVLALLHDVVEDCCFSISHIIAAVGLSSSEGETLSLLTHGKEDSYENYIARIKTNEQATRIKIADLRHNMDWTRLMGIAANDVKRTKKYMRALQVLTEMEVDGE